MGAKVTFNEITKIIEITLAPDINDEIFIDVKEDLYSDGKEDWVANENLRKFYFPIEAVGGNPLPGEKALGTTFFLASDWKIRPYNASHRLIINGNLYAEDGSDPFLDTIGTYTVRIMQQVSSLVDSTVQQLTEIEYASYNGGVTVDVLSSYSGTDYPVGTPQQPVNNLSDALDIAADRGFTVFYILGDITVGDGLDFTQISFIGESIDKTEITIDSDANVDSCEFYEATITGTLDGQCKVKECRILDVNYISGVVELCILSGAITLGGGAEAYFLDCWAGTNLGIPPSIDLGGSGQTLVMQNFNGYISWKNKSGASDQANASLNAGWIVLESTITAGDITIIGTGYVEDNSTGSAVVNIEHLVNPDNISNHVWDEILTGSSHNIPTSAGRRLRQLGDPIASSINDPNPSTTKFITNLTESHDNFFKDQFIRFSTGNLTGFVRIISAYDGTTHEITVEEPCVEAPANGDEFDIIPTHIHPMSEVAETVWTYPTALKLLGLVQENYVMDQQVYDDYNGAKLLTSARIRTYQDSAKTQLIATYQVTATWSNGACTSYQMVIV